MKFEREIAIREKYNVVVVGGGIAGIAASVAAARQGVSVLLIEKGINLGGLATVGLISWYEPLCDGCGKQMIYGISEELIRLSAEYGFDNMPTKWGGAGRNKSRGVRFATYYSPTVFSLALDKYVEDNGVSLRFDTLATYPMMEGNICNGIVAENANGCELYEADMVIDATGDASIFHRSGANTVNGKNYMTYIAHCLTKENADALAEDGNFCAARKWLNAGSNMVGVGHPEGMERLSGTTAEEINEFVITGKRRMLNKISEMPKDSFDLMALPSMPQFRTVRRIVGNSDFCAVDGLEFSDSIGTCGDFRKQGMGNHYQIPFSALWNSERPNLLAAGRIISAPEGDGWEVSRVIPVCALTGEAAGRAAALCVNDNKRLSDITPDDIERIKIN